MHRLPIHVDSAAVDCDNGEVCAEWQTAGRRLSADMTSQEFRRGPNGVQTAESIKLSWPNGR